MESHYDRPHVEDVLPVRSRVSWGSVFAGAFVAITLYLLLALFGGAVGLTLTASDVESGTIGIFAAIWTIFSLALALFAGGCTASRVAVGETQTEAMLHGLLTWGVVLVLTFFMLGVGVRTGISALMGGAYLTRSSEINWDSLARAGVPPERINEWRQQVQSAAEQARLKAQSTEVRQDALNATTAAMWWTFAGTLLSIGAAVTGSLAGAGPELRFFNLGGRTRVGAAESPEVVHH